jgi:hypothetical protein
MASAKRSVLQWPPMSLAIAIKSAEGIVLAADSRVTLFAESDQVVPGRNVLIPATYDNATKLLGFRERSSVGALTYGMGALGMAQPRTAGSYLSEFEASIAHQENISVEDFARELGKFFTAKWTDAGMPPNPDLNMNMFFFVGGYSGEEPYGRLYEVAVPSTPEPVEKHVGTFGAMWGGQHEYIDRLFQGFDTSMPGRLADFVKTTTKKDIDAAAFAEQMKQALQPPIPWQFLPLQDCVDIAIFLVKTTIAMQRWIMGVRGVGGAVDVATITRKGYRALEIKQITTKRLL